MTTLTTLASSTTGEGAVPEFTGLSGVVVDVIAALGELGVGALTLVETVFPPIPSEVILPLAGYLSERGVLDVALVMLLSTLGSLLGAMILYEAGRRLGTERAARILARLPLVDVEDVDAATDWFVRHGRPAVFFGRLVPGVRSLISIPAGTARMPRLEFVLLTTAGSALWNGLLVGAGYALGTQWQTVEKYAEWLDVALYAAIAAVVVLFVTKKLRARRQPASRDRKSATSGPAV